MIENWETAFQMVLKHEGGFVNNPKDPGGMTNLGVTKKVWEEFVGREVDEREMRALTPDVVKPLYKKNYWDKIKAIIFHQEWTMLLTIWRSILVRVVPLNTFSKLLGFMPMV